MAEYLFVCGTLLPELAPDHLASWLHSLKSVGGGQVRGRLYDLGEYPGAVLDEGAETTVRGRIFELPGDPRVLQALDDYECIDPNDVAASLFIRTRTTATTDSGGALECWIYVYNRDVTGKALVPGGDYLKFVSTESTSE